MSLWDCLLIAEKLVAIDYGLVTLSCFGFIHVPSVDEVIRKEKK